jgi:hypothetical protein
MGNATSSSQQDQIGFGSFIKTIQAMRTLLQGDEVSKQAIVDLYMHCSTDGEIPSGSLAVLKENGLIEEDGALSTGKKRIIVDAIIKPEAAPLDTQNIAMKTFIRFQGVSWNIESLLLYSTPAQNTMDEEGAASVLQPPRLGS